MWWLAATQNGKFCLTLRECIHETVRLALPFYPIVPRPSWVGPLVELGVKTIQLRIKDLSGQRLEHELDAAITVGKASRIQLLINDHWELGLKHQAFGVHLVQEDLASADVEQLRSNGNRLGISTHY
jgi:thiamine monophosphate synthase